MASATETLANATEATDAGKSLLGGRKPTDLAQGELDKASGQQLAGVVNQAVEQGKEEKSSLRIHIELDLDVEVHLTARVKGDITIGLL